MCESCQMTYDDDELTGSPVGTDPIIEQNFRVHGYVPTTHDETEEWAFERKLGGHQLRVSLVHGLKQSVIYWTMGYKTVALRSLDLAEVFAFEEQAAQMLLEAIKQPASSQSFSPPANLRTYS